jgi:hemolysin-activating ACP:hemolysin acyltransferase
MHDPDFTYPRAATFKSPSYVDSAAQNEKFRSKILAKLGNVEDSKEEGSGDELYENQIDANFGEGLEMLSDMDYA